MMRSWSSALAGVPEPARRCAIALTAALPLVPARRGLVFDGSGILVSVPEPPASAAARRLLDAARGAESDELAGPRLYVSRLRPDRPERLALQWADGGEAAVRAARTMASACAWALEPGGPALEPPAELPGPAATLRRFAELARLSRRLSRPFAVLHVEVPGLTAAAKALLGDALQAVVRAGDVIGRLGPDTFLAVLGLAADELEAFAAAERLLRTAGSVAARGAPVVGVAISPQDGSEPADLLRHAGAAAHDAPAGAPGVRWYRETAIAGLRERAELRRRLAAADPGEVLELRYRPIFETTSGELVGAMADVCRRDGGLDDPPPELGRADAPLRDRVESWAIREAAATIAGWQREGLDLRIHLAVAGLSEPLLETVAATFGCRTWLRRLCLELGEEAFAEPHDAAMALLRRLRSRGVMLGLDLRRASTRTVNGLAALPLDLAVVDLSRPDHALTMIALGTMVAPHLLGEGVPDDERSRWLHRNGVREARPSRSLQPLDATAFAAWTRTRRVTGVR